MGGTGLDPGGRSARLDLRVSQVETGCQAKRVVLRSGERVGVAMDTDETDPTAGTSVVIATDPPSDTGSGVAAGIALAQSTDAQDDAEHAEQIAEQASDNADTATNIALDANATAAETSMRQDDTERTLGAIADTLAVHSQALAALLEDRQTAKTPAKTKSVKAPTSQGDSAPRSRHWLDKPIGRRQQ